MNSNDKIKKIAIECGEIDGYEYWITECPYGGLNGYICFPKRPLRETGYSGILDYVPVHGGITYSSEDHLGMLYGFDTAHCDSDKFPRCDSSWIKSQLKIMLDGINKAVEVEDKYLTCKTNKGKAKHCDAVRSVAPETDLAFGAIINFLSGKL